LDEVIKKWVETEEKPSNLYQLLGRPIFDPDGEGLLQAARKATSIVHLYHNHHQKKVVDRAHQVEMQLEEAERIFSSEDLWREYDQRLTEQLCVEYAEGVGENFATWQSGNLRNWLRLVKLVHPKRVEDILAQLLTQSVTLPNREMELKDTFEVGPLLKRKSPMPHQSIAPTPQSDVLSQNMVQPSTKKHPGPLEFQRSPPTTSQSEIYSRPEKRGVFWIVISAILTFLILSLIALAIILFRLGTRGG
jgi:hypothetical protein